MLDLAVVIVSWNVRELLAACLHSLFTDISESNLRAQVWVVDNDSADGTPEMVEAEFPGARLVRSGSNLGFAAGNNLALSTILDAPPPLVWLLNPDTVVQPGATRILIDALEDNPQAGIAGAKLFYPDGSLQHSAFRFPGVAQLAFEFLPLPSRLYNTSLNGRYSTQSYDGQRPFLVDHPLGAAMMVRTATIEQVGLLDEEYHMYCEEIDWCWRMRRAGWRALCVPTAHVIHYSGQSTVQIPVSSFANLWVSRARLYSRYHSSLTRRLCRWLVSRGMRRRMQEAEPEMTAACKEILSAWNEIV